MHIYLQMKLYDYGVYFKIVQEKNGQWINEIHKMAMLKFGGGYKGEMKFCSGG